MIAPTRCTHWIVAALLTAGAARANNLVITNVALANAADGRIDVIFDIGWEHSWRYDEMAGGIVITNHDAAWVFVKYRAGGDWKHLLLTDTGQVAAAGTEIKLGSTGGANVGAFIFRNADGSGALSATGMSLRWDYVAQGLTGTNGVDISVHGIEMAYVPKGAFYVGSGGTEPGRFHRYPTSSDPFFITNDAEIVIGTETGNLYYAMDTGYYGDGLGPLPAAFPAGYDAFYCMKHEITQGQYAQFLNRVPAGTDGVHFPNAFALRRHTIRTTNGVYVADAPDRACNYLSWDDVTAFLDWAGLRPMSELEYEKACRGPVAPVANEYAWGDAVIAGINFVDGTDGSGTETANGGNAHIGISSASNPYFGPLRAGIFATASSTRQQAGAGYYGAMDLTGNVFERAVTVGHPQGRAFAGSHGDGDTNTGNPDWPDGATAAGAGQRGSDFSTDTHRQTSDRYFAAYTWSVRHEVLGGRGVRTE